MESESIQLDFLQIVTFSSVAFSTMEKIQLEKGEEEDEKKLKLDEDDEEHDIKNKFSNDGSFLELFKAKMKNHTEGTVDKPCSTSDQQTIKSIQVLHTMCSLSIDV